MCLRISSFSLQMPVFYILILSCCSFIQCQKSTSDLENRFDDSENNNGLDKLIEDFISQFLGANGTGINLDTWEPPKEMKKNFVYYLSGHDDDDRPVWIAEWGKWDAKKYIESGVDSEEYKNFDRYADQQMLRMLQSVRLKAEKSVIFIIDMEKYPLEQLTSAGTLVYLLRKFASWNQIAYVVDKGFIVNTNFVAERIVNLIRPVMGAVFGRFEICGTTKEKWIPKLLKLMPRSELPEWYGGVKDFRPLKVYG